MFFFNFLSSFDSSCSILRPLFFNLLSSISFHLVRFLGLQNKKWVDHIHLQLWLAHQVCYCDVDSPLVTAWTDENLERRFHGCGKYFQRWKWSFFRWFDPEVPERQKKLIRGLLNKNDALKNKEKNACVNNCNFRYVVISKFVGDFQISCHI